MVRFDYTDKVYENTLKTISTFMNLPKELLTNLNNQEPKINFNKNPSRTQYIYFQEHNFA